MGKAQNMSTRKIKGLETELLCQAYLTSLGYNVSVPIGEDCRYDIILDIKKELLKIQIKTCQVKKNGISINTTSVTTSGKENNIHKYTKEEIDYFATYYNNQCYLIPIEECVGTTRMLSFSKNKTNSAIPLYINDFLAENIIQNRLNNIDYKKEEDKRVCQYDLNDNLINRFYSYEEAGQFLGKTSAHISQCARGLRKTAYGYKWVLKE